MPSIQKPPVRHPGLPVNELGLSVRDYEGAMSTLCAGCGHDSVTAAIVQALWEVAVPPHMVAKLSGIGCSAKTTAYFVHGAHGFNGLHGRMAPLATGASAANRDLLLIGISGDGDSLSIGIGHLVHLIRRNLRMVYIIENNGVYGLTKGQLSASADVGSTTKRGTANAMEAIDPLVLGLSLGATFLARGFSGDKAQLVPILKAATAHRGLALVDVISPCVTFNDHEGSTKSYRFTRQHGVRVTETDFVPPRPEILASIGRDGITDLTLHDGSRVRARAVPPGYDPSDRDAVGAHLREAHVRGEVLTGILFVDAARPDLHELSGTVLQPLVDVPFVRLCPGAAELERFGEV
ncbi:MAG: 2-oxoacid:ferredoxin oxidoreductase subunit beta [Candidatus Dormiibacterota bacterium]